MSEGSLSVVGTGSLPDVRVLPGEGGSRNAGGLQDAGGVQAGGGLQDAGALSPAAVSAVSPMGGGASEGQGGPSSLSSAALPWGFAGFTKREPEFSVWDPESWRPAAKRGVEALLRKGEEALKADRLRRRAGALDALCLRGKDPVFDKRIGEFPELAYILKAAERGSETFHHLIGYEAAALGNGDAYGLASRLIDARPERERGALRQKLSACKNERDGYVFVGKLIDVSAGEGWQELLRKREEFQKGLDLFGKELLETLPRCVRAGGSLPPALLEKATRYGDAETILAAHKKASAAFEQVKSLNRGGMSEGVFAARVQLRAEALEKEFYGSLHFGWPGSIHVPTREEYEQQARSDLGKDIAISREQMAGVLDLLRDADGRVDPRALAAFKLAVVAEMADQQTIIESKFWRNFGEGVADYVKNSSEFVERTLGPPRSMRYVPAAGGLASGVWMPEFDAERGARARAEWERMYKDPNVNAFVDFLRSAESVRLSASDAAGELTILLSDLGTVVGENAIPLGISALTGGGVLMAAATYAPMGINREIDSAYADGKSNPELYGWIVGGAGAVAEGSFGVATRGLPIVGRVAGRALDKAALRMMDVPVLGRALGAVQSRGYLRYAVSGALETSGELVGENYIAQALSYPAIEVLRACGADLDRAVFNPWEVSREGLMNERQVAATGTYCFLLGLLHAPAQHRAAVDFSRDRRHLLAAGLTERSASSLAAEAELIGRRVVEATMKGGPEAGERLAAELEQGFAERSFSLFDREVIQESTRNPEALRDRLARENGLFMSQVDAEAAYREGVLQVALREMGVLSTERTLSGKNVVVFVDEKRAAEDRKGWKDGVAPEGYESPLRREEWTDDQLLAYAQVAFDQSATRRMKTIRSAALALDMAERINEGEYAGTIPLTRAGAHVTEVLKKNGGRMNAGVMKALAEAAYKEGEAGRELLPGVDNVVLQGVGRSFVKRLEWEGRHGDASLAARILSGEGGAGAVRVNASSGPASRILMNPGTTLSLHLAEDAVESMLVQKLRDEGGLDEDGAITPAGAAWLAAMHDEMLSVRAQILAATGKDVMPGLEKARPGLQSVTEYFSHLAQSSFYQNADETNLSPEAARHVRYMDSALMQAKFLNDMGAVYASWSRTPAGERWLSEGGSLAVLLESAGHELHRLYSQSTLTHENVASVEEARRAAREAEGQGVGGVSASAAPDAAATSYAEADGFSEASGFALANGLKENIELATANRLKARTEIPLCTVPRSLVALGERDAGIVTSASVIKKLKNKHGFSDAQIYELVEKLDDPLLVMSDREHSYMFLLDMTATNNRGVESPVISALSIRKDGGHFVLSAYALDSMQKVEEKLRRGELVYSRYSQGELRKQQEEEAAASSNHAPGLLPDLVRLLVGHGFRSNPITRADLVKRPTGERLENESGFALADGLKEKIELATKNRLGNGVLVPLCNMPRALQALGERTADIAARGSVLKKLKNKHGFSDEQIYELIEMLDDPLMVMSDRAHSYMFLLDMTARNNKKADAPVMVAVSIKKENEHLMLSAYALDSMQKVEEKLRRGELVYSRYSQGEMQKEAATYLINHVPGITPDLVRLTAGHGFRSNPITRADLVKRPTGERLENESGFALADEATGDAGGSSASGRYRVNNDRVGLARHLDDKVEPVEIRFTPEQRGTKDWMNETKAYIREYLAGKIFDIGRTGKRVFFKSSSTSIATAVKGARSQKRTEIGKRLDDIIKKAYQLSVEEPTHKENEGRHRKALVDASRQYERFGYPVNINGNRGIIWFGGHQLKSDPEGLITFYEFGIAENQQGESAVVQAASQKTRAQRTTDSPAESKLPTSITLGEALREVNGKIKGMPEITLAGGELPRPALDADPGASASFSLLGEKTAERELPGIRACIDALAEGKEGAEIHNAAWGHTITVPRGRVGKKGYGVDHMQEKRMLHGFTPDEAAFITVCAMKAAESVAVPKEQGNALWFEKFGVRAVVSNNDSQRGLLLTGYVWGTRGKNKAVDSEAATLAEHFYALDDLSRNRHVGAALKRALSRFETIVKQNPRTWESVIEHEIAKLRVKQNSKQNGSFMREADGRKTTLSEEEWLTMQTGALDSIGEGRKGGPGNDGGRPEGRYGSTSSFSLIGEHAATWEEHKRRAFTGRADGKARAELDASQARLAAEVWQRALEQKTPEALPLGRLMEFPELYAAYPELAELPVRVTSELGRTTAGSLARDTVANRQTILLNAALKPEAVLPTLLHEVQHAVQKLEGFAPGGTFLDAYDVYARRLNAMIDELEGAGKGGRKVPSRASAGESLPRLSGDIVRSVAELNELLAALDVWKGKRAERVRREAAAVGPRLMELYRNMPGEVEARRVAERLGLSAEERARQPFEEGGQGEKVAQPARAPEAAKATQEPPRQVRAAESRDRDALDERRSSGLKPKKRTGKDQANGSRDEAPLAEEVGLISEKQALKRLSRRYEVRDRQKRRVRFGNKTKGHLGDKDKDRSNRYRDLLLAEDTVKTGRCKGDYRRHYGKVYRDASGKEFGMLVIVVKDRAEKDEVLNFMRKTPASKLWKGVEQNDKK